MSPEILGVIVGGLIGTISSLAGAYINHHLTMKRDEKKRKDDNDDYNKRRMQELIYTSPRDLSETLETYKFIELINVLSRKNWVPQEMAHEIIARMMSNSKFEKEKDTKDSDMASQAVPEEA